MLLIACLCETLQVNIIALLLISCSSFISILCPVGSSSYPVDRVLVGEVRKLPGRHNPSLAETLLNALMQTQGGLLQELVWSYLLLNVEMTLCIIFTSGAALTSAE